MGLRLENTVPGPSSGPQIPGDPVCLGMRSDTGSVAVGTIRVDLAYTNIISRPNQDPLWDSQLHAEGVTVALASPDRRNPIDGIVSVTAGPSLVLLKAGSSYNEQSVYEVSADTRTYDSVLAHFKFKKGDWTTGTKPYTDVGAIAAPYFGLENGVFNTGAFCFLAAGGETTSLVFGGVPTADDQPRAGQQELSWDWGSVAIGDTLELFLLFNINGYPSPFEPSNVPTVEVWGKLPTDPGPVYLGISTTGAFGQFPTPEFDDPNSRTGTSTTARSFFGNVGDAGEIVEIISWALYTDYRFAVRNGTGFPGTNFSIVPDSPAVFYAPEDRSLTARKISPWESVGNVSEVPYFQPGRKKAPLYTSIVKSSPGLGYVRRTESVIGALDSGVMVEAFMSIQTTSIEGAATGMGIAVDEGSSGVSYRLMAVDNGVTKTFGILYDRNRVTGSDLGGYYVADSAVSFQSLKLVQLIIDRLRDSLDVYVEGTLILHTQVGAVLPASNGDPSISIGHIESTASLGSLGLAKLTYVTRYGAWDVSDQNYPDAAEVGWFNSNEMGAPQVEFNLVGESEPTDLAIICGLGDAKSYILDSSRLSIYPETGLYVEASVAVDSTSPFVDAGILIDTEFVRVYLSFFNCGLHGLKVGVLPGSGAADDIINQTELGRKFSVSHDWTVMSTYRLLVRPYKSIDLYINNFKGLPILSIPWRNNYEGFDLPQSDSFGASLAFGHIDSMGEGASSSITYWKNFRWGESRGMDVSVSVDPKTLGANTFGGTLLVFNSFDEQQIVQV